MDKKILLVILFGLFCVAVGGTLFYYESSLGPTGNEKSEEKEEDTILFVVAPGQSSKSVIDQLQEANLIKNKYTAYLYYRLNGNKTLQAGTYMLNRSMDLETILDKIYRGDIVSEVVQITFIEGKRLPSYVSLIEEGFDYTEEEIYAIINDVAYLNTLISKYWFLDESILQKGIYYPLEGYLYPDTYVFDKDVTIEEIIEKLLNNTQLKLEPYKEELLQNEEYSVHDFLTIASIIELEGSSEYRNAISQVIHSRLKDNWALGMDVTTFYAARLNLTDTDKIGAYLNMESPYNTRLQDGSMNGKLPIGPIGNPSVDSINAALHPSDTNYYFFVANVCTGEVLFQENVTQFTQEVARLSNECELN